MLVLAALAVAGCGRSAGTDKAEEAPRVTVAHPVVRSLVDEDDYNGWLEASKTVEVRARVRGHITEGRISTTATWSRRASCCSTSTRAPFRGGADAGRSPGQGAGGAEGGRGQESWTATRNLVKAKAVAHVRNYEKSVADAQSYHGPDRGEECRSGEVQAGPGSIAKITAPIAGRISQAMLTEGNLVNAGGSDPLLTTIVAIDPIYVDFNVDERAMQRYQEIGAGRQGKDKQQPLREQKIPFSFGLDTEKGFPHRGPARVRGQQVHRGHRHDPGPRRRSEP